MYDSSYKKILIVSNNALSLRRNNGKTLESFFKNFPKSNIAQLYFSEEIPESEVCDKFFKISDLDIIRYLLKKTTESAPKKLDEVEMHSTESSSIQTIKKTEFKRVLREIMWRKFLWNTEKLREWIHEFSPDVIFFCAGDSCFAYEIVNYIKSITNAKLIVYITDDYIVNLSSSNLWYRLRTHWVKKKMKDAVLKSDLFVTISKKMSDTYKRIFGKESIILLNISEPLDSVCEMNLDGTINMTYMGGFSYNRDKILKCLASEIDKINREYGKIALTLSVYSNDLTNSELIKHLKTSIGTEFGGSLSPVQVRDKLKTSDVLVHVESFDSYAKAKTSMSVSTKIPEYLSAGKLILAIGPQDVASMEYLNDVALCITDESCLHEKLEELIEFNSFLDLPQKALALYNLKHHPNVMRNEFERIINGL